jgi:sugar/nucleoside kinase (ribokinase family)
MSGGFLQLSGIVMDIVHRIDHLPQPGEEVEARDFMITPGGGFNAMVAARRLNAPVTYGGTLGTGNFAAMAAHALAELNIPTAATMRATADQGSCVVLVHPNGERSFITHHGAERQLSTAHLDALDAPRYAYALLSGYTLYKAESARVMVPWLSSLPRPPLLVFDPGPTIPDIPLDALRPALARADWISANLAEAQFLTNTGNAAEAAEQLSKGRSGALVRVGAQGCWMADGSGPRHIPGFAVKAIDSNGAGDTHTGAFIAALMAAASPDQAATVANAAAALSTTKLGPATAPGWADIIALLEATGRSASLPAAIGTSNRGS